MLASGRSLGHDSFSRGDWLTFTLISPGLVKLLACRLGIDSVWQLSVLTVLTEDMIGLLGQAATSFIYSNV